MDVVRGLEPSRGGSPHIVVAMDPQLMRRFFDGPSWERLMSVGPVSLIGSWENLHTQEARAILRTAEIVVTGWGTGIVDSRVLQHAPRLKYIIHSAGSVRGLVTPECYDHKIFVSSQADINAIPVAEFALAMVILAGKKMFAAQQVYRERRGFVDVVAAMDTAGNYGRHIGVVGASKIGRRLIALLSPFDFRVSVSDPYLDLGTAAELGVGLASLSEVMEQCSVVSLHAPLLASTRGMITAAQLARLCDGATLINTARGGLIDQDALICELQSGRINAILDVTDPEVASPDSPLWQLENVLLTPHIAGAVGNELHRLGQGTVDEVWRAATGLPLARRVSRAAFEERA